MPVGPAAEHGAALWPMAVYLGAVLAVVAGMMVLSHLLGQRRRDRATNDPYESGIVPTGTARLRMSVRFYLVAMFFVVFDLEAMFIFAWAVSVRETGWPAYAAMVAFIGVLLIALAYLWRQGALDWAASGRHPTEGGKQSLDGTVR